MGEEFTRNTIIWASWSGLNKGVIAFERDWSNTARPKLYWGEEKVRLRDIRRLRPIEFGWHGRYFGQRDKIVFLVPHEETREKAIYLAGSFNGWGEARGNVDWRLHSRILEGKKVAAISVDPKRLSANQLSYFKFIDEEGNWLPVAEDASNVQQDGSGFLNYTLDPKRTGRHLFEVTFPVDLQRTQGSRVYLKNEDDYGRGVRMRPGVYLKSLETSCRLGAWIEGGKTHFRLFAPRARTVRLFLYEHLDTDSPRMRELEIGGEMVWEISLRGDFTGWYYHYQIEGQSTEENAGFNPAFKVVDPYALAMVGPHGPGIILDADSFQREAPAFQPPAWQDLVIGEFHLRDLIARAPIDLTDAERKGFRGLIRWLREDHTYLDQLGVNAVEFQPLHQFDEKNPDDYAWGYMPLNYFAPASQYARDPAKGSQIEEMRELVEILHDRGKSVILDVVYNHLGEPNFLQFIDKAYYFLLTKDGHFENHSGCGNTLDCNTPMVRRLIRDSLVHWIKVFDIDGFRFDLGELIGVETLAWLEKELKAVKPGILLVAEPWSFRGHIGKALSRTGVASWNDGYREQIRGFILGNADAGTAHYFIRGSREHWASFPSQTVNYLESHDDRCWIDKITQNGNYNGDGPTSLDRRRTHLMIATLLSSIGLPMILSGIDFLKSKYGVNNTYQRGDLNAMDYRRATFFPNTVQYVRSWIRLRLSGEGSLLRLAENPPEDYFVFCSEGNAIALLYNAAGSHGVNRLLFAINPSFQITRIGGIPLGKRKWEAIADAERVDPDGLDEPLYAVGPDWLELPPVSCGLWRA